MREILFRGKAIDVRCNERWIGKGEWVYGFYHYTNWYDRLTKELVETNYWILPVDGQDACQVDPSTVGQYTGLTDKNGVKIFEGDIVEHDFGNYHIGNRVAIVKYSQKYCGFLLRPKDNWAYCEMDDCVVIGNVHDNPELLESK